MAAPFSVSSFQWRVVGCVNCTCLAKFTMLRRAEKREKQDIQSGSAKRREPSKHKSKSTPLGSKLGKDEREAVLDELVLGDDGIAGIGLDQQPESKKKKAYQLDRPKAAWEDKDDHIDVKFTYKKNPTVKKTKRAVKVCGNTYQQELRTEFEHVSGSQSWAKLKWEQPVNEDSEGDSDEEGLLQSTSDYLGRSQWLAKDFIQIKQCPNANQQAPTQGKLRAVEFHPTAQVVLTGGADNTLRLFQVDGKTNPVIQSIFLEQFPIFTAHFTMDGNEVILGSRHKSFFCYDMIAGKIINVPKIKGLEERNMGWFDVSPDGQYIVFRGHNGHMHLIAAKSKEWISTLKMNGSVEAVAFSKDGSMMLSHGDDGEVYVWDMKTRDCVHRFYDEGTLRGTALAVSNNSQYIATGSYSGVVNVYDSSCLSAKTPKPLKAIMNLRTPCTQVRFNPTSEILAISSNYTEQALRLVHFPSMTAFSNFPEKTDVMRIPMAMDFSLNSGYFTVATHKGTALLYRVKHYANF